MPFRDIVGHRLTLVLLARAVARRSLPPSLLFAGPAGVGKRLTAVALAQALNCLEPRADVVLEGGPDSKGTTLALDACGTCAACSRIRAGSIRTSSSLEPDDEAGNIKIDSVRELIDRIGYRPFEGRRRVVIIDDADALLDSAQNALLKTLEEPPSTSVFILVTAQPDVLLPTVRSRCPQAAVRARCRLRRSPRICSRRMACQHGEAHATAAASDGSVGLALESGTEAVTAIRDAREAAARAVGAAGGVRGRLAAAQTIVGKTRRRFRRGRARSAGDAPARAATLLRDIECSQPARKAARLRTRT